MPRLPYHRRFRRFRRGTLVATDQLFRSRPWRGTETERLAKYRTWAESVAATYGIAAPSVIVVPASECFGSGAYQSIVAVRDLTATDAENGMRDYIARTLGAVQWASEDGTVRRELEVTAGTIMLPPTLSVVTLFHEFRHHMQATGAAVRLDRANEQQAEEDARAWSLSLYYRSRPALFRRAVENGRIYHLTVADLD